MAEKFRINVNYDIMAMAVRVEQSSFKSFTKWTVIANLIEEVLAGFCEQKPPVFKSIAHDHGSGLWECPTADGVKGYKTAERVCATLAVALEPHGVDVRNAEEPDDASAADAAGPKLPPARGRAKRPKKPPTEQELAVQHALWSQAARDVRTLKLELQDEEKVERHARTKLHAMYARLGIKFIES